MADALQTQGDRGGLDDRGFQTETVRHAPVPRSQRTTVGAATYDGLPQKPGGRTWNQLTTGDFEVFVTYEGHTGSGETMSEKFVWQPSSTDEPIESHPKLTELMAEYGGWIDGEGKVKFPPFLPKNANTISQLNSAAGLLSAAGFGLAAFATSQAASDLAEPNPMFGAETYTVRRRVGVHTFASRRYPKRVAELDGKVVKKLPSKAPGGERSGRDYLVLVPKLEWRGSEEAGAYDVEVHYIESEEGGFPPQYKILN